MKKQICLVLLVAASALGQPAVTPPAPAAVSSRPVRGSDPYATGNEAPKLTKFNLDFSGGTPKQLVAAIEKATGRPLNVVIPDEYADESIPALRMTQVTAAELFRAMEMASVKTESYPAPVGFNSYQQINTSISFQTLGAATDDSIWYFRGRVKKPDLTARNTKPAPAKVSRFYALTPYLEQGLKVEDITTAVQTGWKMLGDTETPNISYHKETKLLIAVGEAEKLETIDAVLKALNQKSVIDPATGLPVPQAGSFTERLESIIRKAATTPAPLSPPSAIPERPLHSAPKTPAATTGEH